jgi:hypothetical protein
VAKVHWVFYLRKKEGIFMTTEAREAQKKYFKEYRKRNKPKYKKYRETYWEKRAKLAAQGG